MPNSADPDQLASSYGRFIGVLAVHSVLQYCNYPKYADTFSFLFSYLSQNWNKTSWCIEKVLMIWQTV